MCEEHRYGTLHINHAGLYINRLGLFSPSIGLKAPIRHADIYWERKEGADILNFFQPWNNLQVV